MNHLQQYIRNVLLESIRDSFLSSFFNHPFIEFMDRRDVPSKEVLSSRRPAIYIAIKEGDCTCLCVLEERSYWHLIYQEQMRVLYVHSLRTYPGKICQGKGLATKMKLEINNVADKHGIHLVSQVLPYGADKMSQNKMVEFNKRFGFKPIKEMINEYVGTDEDVAWEVADVIWGSMHPHVEMYRSPKGYTPPPPSGIIPSKEFYEEDY